MKQTLFFLRVMGFCLVLTTACSEKYHLSKVWETGKSFRTPESVVYDKTRALLYVSNYNRFPAEMDSANDCISVLDLEGNIVESEWITGLKAPCGICLHEDYLYVCERDGISKYAIPSGERAEKYPIAAGFLNDVTVDDSGIIYFTDTSPRDQAASCVCSIKQGAIDTIASTPVIQANGIQYHEGSLLIGNSGDLTLKGIDLGDRSVHTIARLDTGIIDGIKIYDRHRYLVSHWEGSLYLVTAKGGVEEILNTRGEKINIADFEFIPDRKLIVIPTFRDNRVIAYRIGKE